MSRRHRRPSFQSQGNGSSVRARAKRALANGDGDSAVNILMASVRSHPASSELWFALGETCASLGRMEGAVAAIRQACVLEPMNGGYRVALADAFFTSGARELALAEYLRATELDPGNATAWANAGALHQQLGDSLAALGALGKALEIDPHHALALNNSGLAFSDIGDFGLARECLRLAVENKPDYPAALWNRAILDLLHGDFEAGWAGHEYRFVQLERMGSLRTFPERRWQGEDFVGKRLLVWPEQGLGDQLQFVRFIPEVKSRGGTVVLMCAAALEHLFREVIPEADEIVVVDMPYDSCDLQVPLMSLPFILGCGEAVAPRRIPYITPPNTIPSVLDGLLPHKRERLRAGVVWAGQPRHQNDHNRSIGLDTINRLFEVPGIEWVSVQKGDLAEAHLRALNISRRGEGKDVILPLGAELRDFVDTAHALSRLDLVITVDTSVAHLAGAMNVPCWIMLPFNPDWRWQLERSDSPWYPSVRLFRQSRVGNWQTVLDDVVAALSEATRTARSAGDVEGNGGSDGDGKRIREDKGGDGAVKVDGSDGARKADDGQGEGRALVSAA